MEDEAAASRQRLTGIVLVFLSTIAWSSGGLFVRLLPYDMWTIVFWRGLFGTLFIGAFVLWRFRAKTGAIIRRMGWMGLVITAFSVATITFFVPAFQHTSIANAMTIYAALPFFTAAAAWLWLGERPSGVTILASTFVLLGIWVMLGPSTGGPQLGDGFAALATLAMALMTVAIRKSRGVEMLPVACLSTALSSLIALPLADDLLGLSTRDLMVAAGFGLGPMTLGLMFYIIGSALIPSALAALIGTLEAPLGAFWGWIGAGEVPRLETVLGGSIVVTAVVARILIEQRDEARSAARLSD
jgi:drug/metabolite transporter (DMT)-like permease